MREEKTKKKVADLKQATNQSTLQKILSSVVNDLRWDATVAILSQEQGPLIPQVSRGFTEREVRAIFRALPENEWELKGRQETSNGADPEGSIRLRMVSPGSKVILAVPLLERQRVYGALVLGKQENATFTKRDKSSIEDARSTITKELKQAKLFNTSLILHQPFVPQEPFPESEAKRGSTSTYTTPEIQKRIEAILTEAHEFIQFDRAWVTLYDPLAASLEVLGSLAGHKKELLPGQRLLLNESASGWAVRHRKPRIDQNLASTQGRFHDYKQLYRERFKNALVVPFLVRGRVAGTLTLSSKLEKAFESPEADSRKLVPVTTKLGQLFEDPSLKLSFFYPPQPSQGQSPDFPGTETLEPTIRRQERQEALKEVSSFLATEIREPMGFVRAQLEEVTGEGSLDFESQTRIEAAMRDLIRIETLLHEILDFARPLELDRRLCRVPDLLEKALSLILTDLKVSRIEVMKDLPPRLAQVRWDEAKMQYAFLSIFKNALEAMSPGGHLRIAASMKRGRQPEMLITIENDGALIPAEHVDKVFEPYFTTKRSGTGLGLATVKKIVEEHEGKIFIESGTEQGTTVTIRLPALSPRPPYRRRGGPPRKTLRHH